MADVLLLDNDRHLTLIPRTEKGFSAVQELPRSFEIGEPIEVREDYPRFDALQMDRRGIQSMLSEHGAVCQPVTSIEAAQLEACFSPAALEKALQEGHVARCCAVALTELRLAVPPEQMRLLVLSGEGWMSLAARLVRYYEPTGESLDTAEREMLYDALAGELTAFRAWPSFGDGEGHQKVFQDAYRAEVRRRGWVAG